MHSQTPSSERERERDGGRERERGPVEAVELNVLSNGRYLYKRNLDGVFNR